MAPTPHGRPSSCRSVASTSSFVLSYSSFVVSSGAGADFTNVGAITMSVTGVEQDLDLAMIETAGPVIALGGALKADTLVVDNDGDGRADPGDTLRYTITVTNTGAEATSVSLDDLIQPNLAVVADSLFTEPIAAPDTYTACGNILLAVDGSMALPGLTANDHDPDGEAFAISTVFPVMTVRGGTVDNVEPNTGAFDYSPPAGFRGVDTFSYEIEDAGGRTSTASVTLMVDSLVWFVDSGAAAGGTGTQSAPFNTLGDVEAASGPGDVIFVAAGAGDTGDGIVLQDDQQLIGEGVGLMACGALVIPPGARPTLVNSSSTVVRLANGNRIAGLNMEPQGAEEAIVGNLFDGLAVEQVGINTSRGGAGNGGVDLTDATGVVSFDQLTITGSGTGTAFAVTGGAPMLTVSNSTLAPTAGTLLRVIQVAGGTIDFQPSSTLSLAGGTGDAVVMSLNTSTITIASIGDLETMGGGGVVISGSAPVNIGSVANVTATGGPALEITGSTLAGIGGGPVTIESLTSSGSPAHGVGFSTASVEMGVTGVTVISNPTNHGISISGGTGATSFATVVIDGAGGSGLAIGSHAGTLAVNAGTIGVTTPTGANAIDIDGGAGDISIVAEITGSVSARSVEITNRTGGTVGLSGMIRDPGLGVRLDSNGSGTIAFSGALDLDTTASTAFHAANGGTVTVTGSPNTIDTTTGFGVNIVNTDIGAAGVTFRSVSVTGAVNGIVLNNTGSLGFFEVTGDGPSDSSDATRGRTTAGSGGAIALGSGGSLVNTTGDSVTLVNSAGVTLRNMVLTSDGGGSRDGVRADVNSDNLALDNVRITGFSDNGLHGSSIEGLTLQHCEVEGNAKSSDSVVNDEANIQLENVFGASLIANSLIRDVNQDNIRVSSCELGGCGGPTLNLTLDNVAVEDTLPGAGGNAGVLVRSFNDADVALTVNNSGLVRNRASAIQHTTNDPVTRGSTTVTNSTINRSANAVNVAHQGATHSFNIADNQINTVVGIPANFGNAINVYLAGLSPAGSVLQGHITGNTIGSPAIPDSGSENGNGIDLYASGAGTLTARVADNTVRGLRWGSAFRAISATHTGTINLTVKNNDFSVLPTTLFPLTGLELDAGVVAGDTGLMCADITGNITFQGDLSWTGAFIDTAGGNPTVNLVGYNGAANNETQIGAFLDSAATTVNPSSLAFLNAGTVQGQAGACPQPPAP